jgi:hypothetical protein
MNTILLFIYILITLSLIYIIYDRAGLFFKIEEIVVISMAWPLAIIILILKVILDFLIKISLKE